MNRKEVLHAAEGCVCGQREQDYGRPENNFKRIADLWEAYTGHKYTPVDVAIMLALLKVARIGSGRLHMDNFVDGCGYFALAGELAAEAERQLAADQQVDAMLEDLHRLDREADVLRVPVVICGVGEAVAQILEDEANKPRPAAGAAVAQAVEDDADHNADVRNMAESYGDIAEKAMEAVHEAVEASESAELPQWMTEPRVHGAPCLDGLGACEGVETVTAQKLDGKERTIPVAIDPGSPCFREAVEQLGETLSRNLQRTARR